MLKSKGMRIRQRTFSDISNIKLVVDQAEYTDYFTSKLLLLC